MKHDELWNWLGIDESVTCGVIADPHQPDTPLVYVTRGFLTVTGYAWDVLGHGNWTPRSGSQAAMAMGSWARAWAVC